MTRTTDHAGLLSRPLSTSRPAPVQWPWAQMYQFTWREALARVRVTDDAYDLPCPDLRTSPLPLPSDGTHLVRTGTHAATALPNVEEAN